MPESLPDVTRLAAAIASYEVRAVLVGGMAVVYHGATIVTTDVDFAIAYDKANVGKLVKALAPLNPRPMRLAVGAAWVWDELSIRPPWTIFQTDAGRVDLLVRLPNIDSFAGLYERAVIARLGGATVRVASIEDLIAMKTGTGRESDAAHVRALMALRRL